MTPQLEAISTTARHTDPARRAPGTPPAVEAPEARVIEGTEFDAAAEIVLVVTGSRALSDTRAARGWAWRQLVRWIANAPVPFVRVLTGDAAGVDELAKAVALSAEIPFDIYRLNGRISGHDGTRHWYRGRVPDDVQWPLRRNDAMVEDALRARDRGALVRVLALRASWSRTGGTLYTADLARGSGLRVAFLECPPEYGPHVVDTAALDAAPAPLAPVGRLP
jgi:hypothetical protein